MRRVARKVAKIAISIPEDLLAQIEQAAAAKGQSRSEFFRTAAAAALRRELSANNVPSRDDIAGEGGSDTSLDLIEVPGGPGSRQEPVIRGKGVPVWILWAYVARLGMTPERVSDLWRGEVTPEEVRAALAYQRRHPELVEDRLAA